MENSVAIHAMKEELTYLDQMFPISEFVDHFDTFADRSFPSHWHHEFELQIILKGSVEYIVNGTSYVVGRGLCHIYCSGSRAHDDGAFRRNRRV